MNAITDEQINELMVVDSTSSANYDTWQNNVDGDGYEVCLSPSLYLGHLLAHIHSLYSAHFLQHVKLKYNLYYFEVQNRDEALQGQRPKLMQVGPYAYDEYYVFSDGGDTVSYNTQKYYLFNQEETGPGLTQSDQITLPYAVVVGFEFLLQQVPVTAQELLQAALEVCVLS